jgi:hypothetical protein
MYSPLGAFSSENKPAFTPSENITDENFADVQAGMLESISEQIAELQIMAEPALSM